MLWITSLFQKWISKTRKSAAFVKIEFKTASKRWTDMFSLVARGGSKSVVDKILWQSDEVKLNTWMAISLVVYQWGGGVKGIEIVKGKTVGANVTGTVIWVKLKEDIGQTKPFRNCILVRHNSTHPYSSVFLDGVDEWYNGTWPMTDQQRKKNFDLEGKLHSWNEASTMCQRMGIHLLYYTHIEDMANLMHHIFATKFWTRERVQFEALFVDNQNNQKVRKT